MNATADVPSSRLKNYGGGGDRKDRSLFAARFAAILLVVSIAAAAFFASRVLAPPLRSLLRSSASASSPRVLWLFVVVIAAAIWILHHAAAPPHRDGLQFASDWTAQLWHDDEIHPPTMSEYNYYYDNDINATGESAFEAEAARKSTRVVEPPKEEEDDDESMEATWKAIVRRRGVRKSEERVENRTKDDAIDLPRRVVYKEGGVKEKKKAAAAAAAEGWRKREAVAVANDELFRRVETFIKKHYDHLRLQRQESEQRRLLGMFRRRGLS